jgi:hypothetical protein
MTKTTNDSSSITTKNDHDHEDVQSPSSSSMGGIRGPHQESASPPNSPSSNQQRVNIRGKWTHNPVVLAALACSNMSSCEEVKEMYHEW